MSHPKNHLVTKIAAIAALAASSAFAQSTAFTYQGELKSGGQLANGSFDFQFKLFSTATGGSQIGSPVCVNNIIVTSGRFITQVDFGQQYASSASRYLEIQVRADTGLDCSNTTGFTVLTTRQPVTAAPLAAHANSAFSLDSPSGAAPNAVYVSSGGLVGIGTTNPGQSLTIAGNMELGVSAGDYHFFRIGGGNASGFLYGSYPVLGDGIHMGYNYYADGSGGQNIIAHDGQTSRISMGYGYVALATGGVNQNPVNRLVVDQSGNVLIGNNTQYYVPGGEENLRIVRGVITAAGGIIVGSGFQVLHLSPSHYTINFSTPFAGAPAVTANADGGSSTVGYIVDVQGATASSVTLAVNGLDNAAVHFIAVGPR